MKPISIPELSLVVLVGPSGSGKSTFARKNFLSTEIVSSDSCRAMVSDDENDMTATNDAFELLNAIVTKRLNRGRIAVIDATNVQPESRRSLLALAKAHHVVPVAIVLNVDEKICVERNRQRADRGPNSDFIFRQVRQLKKSLNYLKREGFRYIYELNSPDEIDQVRIERTKVWTNRKDDHGPFDIIGDVHGCCDELTQLLQNLGYRLNGAALTHPDGRRAVFLGDLIDRGPRVIDTIRLVKSMVEAGSALCVPGNHENKLVRHLSGRKVTVNHGLEQTIAELDKESEDFRSEVKTFFDGLVSHFVLDDGKLVVAHAGMKESFQGRASGTVRDFALYGETTGETDEFGLPVRYQWAADYRGKAVVVYGHTPVPTPEWVNNTICVDTGCVYGGQLTALRWPERELVSVKAKQVYCQSKKPLGIAEAVNLSAQQIFDDVLDIEDVSGKRQVETRLSGRVTIREEYASAALEVMSRFAVNPKWLTYLPPTMSPTETSDLTNLLEHPAEAFTYYRNRGVKQVVCQEKHMGSRSIVTVCKNSDVARKRFGVTENEQGIVYTRSGRRFFDNSAMETQLISKVCDAFEKSGLWQSLDTDWATLDCELMPWSVKAQELLRDQYAAVGYAGRSGLQAAITALRSCQTGDLGEVISKFEKRLEALRHYSAAYANYCWPVKSIDDLKLAPFHLMATEHAVHADKPHTWHMNMLHQLANASATVLIATPYKIVTLGDTASEQDAIGWWESLTGKGGEGMVVKPMDFVTMQGKHLVQPAMKCRGPEYLRIIYGPEYNLPGNMERLRARALHTKRSVALREFALGIEGLERFVRREPLRKVHECAFAVLAMESEPVDSRL